MENFCAIEKVLRKFIIEIHYWNLCDSEQVQKIPSQTNSSIQYTVHCIQHTV